MTNREFGLMNEHRRGNWIRLRTMIMLRWIAIAGQFIAIITAQYMIDLQLELGLCYLAVGISVIGNLIASVVFPENKRLSETENMMMVMFDLLQLCFLLFLTGGLNNPFAILVLAPVTVSALVLRLRFTLILGFTAFALVTTMMFYHIPLRTAQGFILRMPEIFVFGSWVAIGIALIFISFYTRWITRELYSMEDAIAATEMALSRAQKLNDLGGVVAAAAHELGTPLATIKLTSSELIEELYDNEDLREDAMLIRDQADRCRDILRSMGRAGKDDLHMRKAPLVEVIREAAEPHEGRGKAIVIEHASEQLMGELPLEIQRRPDVIHGLRNLIQNAVDFATSTVWVEANWTDETVEIRIVDDGRGYPPQLIGRIGDPFVRTRKTDRDRSARPEYEGMGLGLFIAKTLLERSGAKLNFANASDPSRSRIRAGERAGALVEVVWPREALVPDESDVPTAQNVPIQA